LLGTLAALWLLAGLLARHFQGLILLATHSAWAASAGYDLLVLPGVVLHELAHLLLAVLLRVRVVRADLFRFRRPGDARQGEVIVQRVDALRMSVIGAGPLLVGVPVTLLLLRWLQLPSLSFTTGVLTAIGPLLGEPRNLVRLYLLWAVANTMFPSAADRAAWWTVGLAATALIALGLVTGFRPALPATFVAAMMGHAAWLTGGLLSVVMLDMILLLLLLALERLAEHMTGRRLIGSR
jgi:hypothetical protein